MDRTTLFLILLLISAPSVVAKEPEEQLGCMTPGNDSYIVTYQGGEPVVALSTVYCSGQNQLHECAVEGRVNAVPTAMTCGSWYKEGSMHDQASSWACTGGSERNEEGNPAAMTCAGGFVPKTFWQKTGWFWTLALFGAVGWPSYRAWQARQELGATGGYNTSSNHEEPETEDSADDAEPNEESGRSSQSGSANAESRKGYYALLGLKKGATLDEIRKTYRELLMEYHPDKNDGARPKVRDLASEKTRELNDAWAVLKDDAARARYNRTDGT